MAYQWRGYLMMLQSLNKLILCLVNKIQLLLKIYSIKLLSTKKISRQDIIVQIILIFLNIYLLLIGIIKNKIDCQKSLRIFIL